MSITLDQLIHDTAAASNDLVEATATANAADLLTFTSEFALLEDDGHFRGCEAYFLDGANAGLSRRVYGSDYETATITVRPALAAPVTVGQRVELYNFRNGGLQRLQYKNIINRLIREASSNFADQVTVPLVGLYGGAQYVVVPAGIDSVCRVQYYDPTYSNWIDLKRAVRPGRRGWFAVKETDSIGFDYGSQLMLTGMGLQFIGYKRPTALVNGTDTTNIDPEWLVESAAGLAYLTNPVNYNNLAPGQYARNRADQLRAKMSLLPMANCVDIR
jgi:hypothetical protein